MKKVVGAPENKTRHVKYYYNVIKVFFFQMFVCPYYITITIH